MTYDDWKSTEPDRDSDPEPEQRCQDCGAGEDEPCKAGCLCFACRSRAQESTDWFDVAQDQPQDAA